LSTPGHRILDVRQGARREWWAAFGSPQMSKEHVFADIDAKNNHGKPP